MLALEFKRLALSTWLYRLCWVKSIYATLIYTSRINALYSGIPVHISSGLAAGNKKHATKLMKLPLTNNTLKL